MNNKYRSAEVYYMDELAGVISENEEGNLLTAQNKISPLSP